MKEEVKAAVLCVRGFFSGLFMQSKWRSSRKLVNLTKFLFYILNIKVNIYKKEKREKKGILLYFLLPMCWNLSQKSVYLRSLFFPEIWRIQVFFFMEKPFYNYIYIRILLYSWLGCLPPSGTYHENSQYNFINFLKKECIYILATYKNLATWNFGGGWVKFLSTKNHFVYIGLKSYF